MVDNGGSAIAVYLGSNVKLSRNLIVGGGYVRQICTYESPYIEISYNTLKDGLLHAIDAQDRYGKVIGNSVLGAKGNGIDTWGEDDILIEDNFVSHIGGDVPQGYADEDTGIVLNGSRIRAVNNTIEFTDGAGIHVGPGNNGNEITGNIIRNCGLNGGWSSAGIWVQAYEIGNDITGTIIRDNKIYDDQTIATQNYGIALMAKPNCYISNITIKDNDLRRSNIAGFYMYKASVSDLTFSGNLQ
jgi:hypothetical protein